MSVNWHAAPVDGTTNLDSAGIDAGPGALDELVGKHVGSMAFATTRLPVTQNGTTVKWGQIDVFHYSVSGGDSGKLIRQVIAAGTLALANGNALITTITDADAATLAVPTAVDIDALPTSLRDKNKIILLARSPMASGTGLLHYVALRQPVNLRGTGALAASTTTTTVTFPTGYTLPSAEYSVLLQGRAAGYYPRDPVVTTKNAGSFVITHTNTAGTEAFDYVVVPD